MSDLRGDLFRRFGAVSSLALPPLIPLGPWCAEAPDTEIAARLATCARAARFELAGYERHQGYLYLAVRCDALEPIRRCVMGAAGDPAGPPRIELPAYPGFLMAGPDLDAPIEVIREAGLPAERSFRSYGLTIWLVETAAPPDRWWDQVGWEETVHVPVKSNGRAAPGSAAKLPRQPRP